MLTLLHLISSQRFVICFDADHRANSNFDLLQLALDCNYTLNRWYDHLSQIVIVFCFHSSISHINISIDSMSTLISIYKKFLFNALFNIYLT